MLLLLAFAAIYGGFLLLALSQKQHMARVVSPPAAQGGTRQALHRFGYALLALALVIALCRDGVAFGLILWAVTLTVGGSAVVATLTLQPRWLARLATFLTAQKPID